MNKKLAYVDPIEIRNAKIAGTIKFYIEGTHICCTDGSCVVYVGEIDNNCLVHIEITE